MTGGVVTWMRWPPGRPVKIDGRLATKIGLCAWSMFA